MQIRMTMLTALALVILATSSLMAGVNVTIGQVVNAQNMTTNVTDSSSNSTGTDDGGSISSFSPQPPLD